MLRRRLPSEHYQLQISFSKAEFIVVQVIHGQLSDGLGTVAEELQEAYD